MSENLKYITSPTQSFAGLPVCTQLADLEADIAIIGLHCASPYPQSQPAATANFFYTLLAASGNNKILANIGQER